MRKLKKINGYLVVRFNDREKREYEGTGLGNFGVIDAELYTGILDVDRMVMEYDDAETLEIALDQARGLESELDVVEPEVKITVIIEGETEVSEEDVEPESLFKGQRATLEARLKHGPHLDLDPLTAAHELHGYARALEDLGMIDGHDERFLVEHNTFGEVCNLYTDEGHRVNVALPSRAGLAIVSPHDFEEGETITGCTVQTLKCRRCGMESFAWSKEPAPGQEETLAYICDEVCKYREGRTQEELDAICAKCKVDRWAGAPPTLTPQEVRELRNLKGLLKEVDNYVNGGEAATPGNETAKRTARRLEMKLPGHVTPETIQEALNTARDSDPPRETFQNAPSGVRSDYNTKKVYALGLALAEECPDNDCRVYLNIFNMARELDAALDVFSENTAPALALRSALTERLGDLWEMYSKNHAVQQYKEGMKNDRS